MITILAIIFAWFLLVEIIKGIAGNKQRKRTARAGAMRQREIEQLRKAQEEDAAEHERMRKELLRQNLEIVQVQKEQIQAAKERAKLEAEQAKQAEILAKHEKRISALEMKIEQADYDIGIEEENLDRYADKLRRLDKDLAHAEFEIKSWTDQRHLANVAKAEEKRDKIKDSIYVWEDRVRKAEKRMAKARRTKEMLETELREVA